MTAVVEIGRKRLHGRVLPIVQARPELVGQVRSTAADLVRAAELVADPADDPLDRPTEELLAVYSSSSTTLPSAPRPSISCSASPASSSG